MTLPTLFYFTGYVTVYNSHQAKAWTLQLMGMKQIFLISETLFE